MNTTLPGKSLEAQFDVLWQRFSRLPRTVDSMSGWSMRIRRWLTPINISFIVPISDPEVCDYLSNFQKTLAPYMAYAPQPAEKLHITLSQVGYLRAGLPLPNTWTHNELNDLIARARSLFSKLPAFTVKVGPINAFPNVAIAEVHDDGQLRLLERAAISVIPENRRLDAFYPLIPHVTLGYFGNRPAAPIAKVLRPLRNQPPLTLKIDRAAMTLYYRGLGSYRTKHVLRHSVEEVIASLTLNRDASH